MWSTLDLNVFTHCMHPFFTDLSSDERNKTDKAKDKATSSSGSASSLDKARKGSGDDSNGKKSSGNTDFIFHFRRVLW